jgi:hypothetical protein
MRVLLIVVTFNLQPVQRRRGFFVRRNWPLPPSSLRPSLFSVLCSLFSVRWRAQLTNGSEALKFVRAAFREPRAEGDTSEDRCTAEAGSASPLIDARLGIYWGAPESSSAQSLREG